MFLYSVYPSWIKPTVVSFLPIRWYAVMYIVALAITYILFRYQCRKGRLGGMGEEQSEDLFLYSFIGLIVGARVFSCLFYEGSWYYWTHPHMIFWPFRNGQFVGLPGMSYHGGVVGGILVCWLYCRRHSLSFLDVADTILCALPLGYTFGRLGNFINGELWGRVTKSSFGMVFPDAPMFSTSIEWVRDASVAAGMDPSVPYVNLPRYPSQLFEAFGEGILLFLILWFVVRRISDRRKTGPGLVTGSYIAGYGIIRFVIEFFREPDEQLGFVFMQFSMGQLLCFLMIVSGIAVMIYSMHTKPVEYRKASNKKGKGKNDSKRKS